MKEAPQVENEENKGQDLILGIVFDGIGMLSCSIPLVGEFSDVVWAPVSGFLMMWMYKGTMGKIAGTFSFLEEMLPFTDVIPSFTLAWIYKYWLKKGK
jgi:hypothetical protein